jgi:hypothetical protein
MILCFEACVMILWIVALHGIILSGLKKKKQQLRGFSLHVNYTDRATATFRRS